MKELRDETIILEVQNGNTEGFAEILERYTPKLLRYTKKFLSGENDRVDIVQDIFTKAYINIQSYDANQPFSPWIYRIAHNECVNFIKKKKSIPFSFFEFDILIPFGGVAESSSENSHRKDLKGAIEKILDRIGEKYREVLILYYFEEQSYKEISEILQIPISSVGVRIQRAKSQVQKLLDEHHIQKYDA